MRSRRADEMRIRAAQARLVSAVLERRGRAVLRVLISNESDAPVLDVSVVPRLLRDGRVIPEPPGTPKDRTLARLAAM
ncbi:hypothetical protein [Micromonospora chersina]|uniref:hypothetical protein n=1 Tax=Micromonospora chersina TaxID=47854 RepID=UPI0037138366